MKVKEKDGFKYIDMGQGDILLLLHGLFGALSNWESVINKFSNTHRIVIPLLPIYDMPLRESGMDGLTTHVEKFVNMMDFKDLVVMGNSLGGHIGLMYTLRNPERVKNLVLTGSSGLFENAMGGSYPKRGDWDYIKERVGYTFYDPNVLGDDYVKEIFETLKSRSNTLRIVAVAKSAQRHNMAQDIVNIKAPTLLVWGLNDTITPPMVAHEFNKLIPNTTLRFIDKCCHAPMMERPDEFNAILEDYLKAS